MPVQYQWQYSCPCCKTTIYFAVGTYVGVKIACPSCQAKVQLVSKDGKLQLVQDDPKSVGYWG